jgi:hypothetical protein
MIELHVGVVGDFGKDCEFLNSKVVGKSNFTMQFVQSNFYEEYDSIETEHTKLVEICGKTVFLRMKDEFVQEGFWNLLIL